MLESVAGPDVTFTEHSMLSRLGSSGVSSSAVNRLLRQHCSAGT